MARKTAAVDAAPPIPSAPSPPAAAPEPESADEAFAQALAGLGDTTENLSADREPEPDEDAPQESEAASDDKPDDKPAAEDPPWTLQQARRYRRQADRRLAEATERERAAQGQQARLEEQLRALESRESRHRELEQLLERDPEAALAALATRAGQDPERWYEQMTVRRANGGAPGGSELLTRIDRLEQALATERADRVKRDTDAQQQAQQQSAEQELHEASLRMVAIRDHETMARRWPHAASLPPQELYARARVELASRLSRASGPVVLDEVVDAVEKEARTLADAVRASKWLGSTAAPAPESDPSPPGAGRRRTPSARDAATTGGTPREMTREEREAAADAALRAAFGAT